MELELVQGTLSGKLVFDVQQDIPGNQSKVRMAGILVKNDRAVGGCWLMGSVEMANQNAAELILTNTEYCDVYLDTEYSGGGDGTMGMQRWSGYSNREITILHGEDGKKSVQVKVSIRVMSSGGWDVGYLTQTVTLELPDIPRASGIMIEAGELGQEMRIGIQKAVSRYAVTINWMCGEQSGTIAEASDQAEFRWEPPVGLAAENTQGTSVQITIEAITMDGEREIGRAQKGAECGIPEGIVPQIQIELSDRMGYAAVYGGYVQSQSQLRVISEAGGAYGSTIQSIAVSCSGLVGAGADVAFSLPDAGDVTVTATATDSRGRTASVSRVVTVLPYQKPRINILSAYRCDADGNDQPDGSFVMIAFSASATAIGQNRTAYSALQKLRGQEAQAETPLPEYAGQMSVSRGSCILAAGKDSEYEMAVQVQDDFQTVVSTALIVPVAFALLDMSRESRAVGIGRRATKANTLEIGLETDMGEHRIINLAAPVADNDAATKGYIDEKIQQLMTALGIG